MADVKRKGVIYFGDYANARTAANCLMDEYPEVRVVRYDLGWAVQYCISGPYYPELSK